MTLTFDDDKQKKNLVDLQRQEEEDLVQTLAEARYGVPPVHLSSMPIENDALRLIEEKDARAGEIAAFKLLGKDVHVAIRSPQTDNITNWTKFFNDRNYTPHFYMASHASLEKAWDRYKEISFAEESKAGSMAISGEALKKLMVNIKNIKDIKKAVEEVEKENTHTTSHILEIALAGAVAIGASDIHFEPEESTVRLRFRLDGILHEVMEIPPAAHKFINSRIKLISGLKITSSSIAQDGRFSIWLDQDEISLRVSLIPGAYGESIVMRILNPKSIRVKLEDMGVEPKLYDIFMKEIHKPNGMILLTGPTGSGKTTTLYSFLQKIYSTEIKIITIEDPIEYHLPGITQTQTDSEKGYTFLEGLRSALRQDPDVIMVGEIRDSETAKIAVESALTGHLVFSTLHTNNAAGVIPRLIDLDVNPKILVSSLSLSIAQRLVRRLCVHCKKEREVKPEEKDLINKMIEKAKSYNKNFADYGVDLNNPFKLYESVGCLECNNTGFHGQIGIFEAIYNDAKIEDIIVKNPSEREIKEAARNQVSLTIQEDGMVKILKGITSYEEVSGVVDFYEE
ncbi:Flp pilus assembly complex ATPase component TadA [Candidatus Nomurabacteria bacterium]|nr:Flp pilus assembly complex ATPase component TadA [Candidatus Nomurabacteria bacterium]